MLIYYRSTVPSSIFGIADFNLAKLKLHDILNSHRFLQYAPELRPRH